MPPRVRIYSAHCSRWDFLYYQVHSLRKFCKDDWELVIINDARKEKYITNFFEESTRGDITEVCKELNVDCIEFPEELHVDRSFLFPKAYYKIANNPNSRCSDVCQYTVYHSIQDKFEGLCVLMDSDMFLVKPVSFVDYMGDHDLFYVPQDRPGVDEYPWNGFVGWWPTKTPAIQELNFDYGSVNDTPTDCGGISWYYFKRHPELKKKHVEQPRFDIRDLAIHKEIEEILNNSSIPDRLQKKLKELKEVPVFTETANGGLYWQFMEDFILHYGQGGNWINKSDVFHLSKTRTLLEYFGDRWLFP